MTSDETGYDPTKGVHPARLQLCERALDRLAEGADPDPLAIAIFEEGELPMELVGPVVGALWRALGGGEERTHSTSADRARFALAELAAGVDPEAVAQQLQRDFSADPDAAIWAVDTIEAALRGNLVEEEFSILDLSPQIRIGVGVASLLFFSLLTVLAFRTVEPGSTVLVAVGAIAASAALVAHGVLGLIRGE